MKQSSRRNLSVYILMLETLLLFVASILGNKISELLQIPDATLLVVITVALLAIILGLMYFRENKAIAVENFRWRFRLTQRRVVNFIFWAWYGSCVLFFAFGVVAFTNYMDKSWTAWLLNAAVIAILFTAPINLQSTIECGHRRWPVAAFALLATLYGFVGFVLRITPSLIEQNFVLFVVVWSVIVTGLKFTVLVHLLEAFFIPWMRTLPEK